MSQGHAHSRRGASCHPRSGVKIKPSAHARLVGGEQFETSSASQLQLSSACSQVTDVSGLEYPCRGATKRVIRSFAEVGRSPPSLATTINSQSVHRPPSTSTMAAVKLPRYVMFKGDNNNNLCLCPTEGHPYLCFNSTNRDLWGAHEVIPVPDTEDFVMVKSLYNHKFWRLSPYWIWADKSSTPSLDDDADCIFQVIQLAPNKVALRNLGNFAFVKRLTTEGKTSALNASASDHSDDVTAQMEVSEALIMRRVFDVEYLLDQMETTDIQPLVLGSARARNNTSSKSDLAVTVTYEVAEVSTWSDSTTFTTGLSVTVKAGVPTVGEAEASVSTELSVTTEMGKENGKTTTVSSTYTVKDVKPGDEVVVRVSGTRAKGKVPYKYKHQSTRVDGLVLPVETGVDGIFTGVQVVNIVWEATDSSGTKKALV